MFIRLIMVLTLLSTLTGYAYFNPIPVRQPDSSNFSKIANDGEPMGPWKGPWACVHDNDTGLLWEVKNDAETIHDGYWTYSWYDGTTGVENFGDCYFESERCDTKDLVRRANQEKTCGRSDWRLPTTAELLSLVSSQARPGEAKIDKDFFPHTKRGDYWSADSDKALSGVFAHLKLGAQAVNFAEAKVVTLPYRNAAFLRLVSDNK